MTLKSVATALAGRFVFDAFLCRMEFAAELLPLCDGVYPATYLSMNPERRAKRGTIPLATWGEYLADMGFADPNLLQRNIAWWMRVIKARRSKLVIGEYAPCAMLAARLLGIPAISVGTGYGTPPGHLERFPILLPDYTHSVYDEAMLLANVNTALIALGGAPLQHFPQLYDTADQWSRTIAALDPYDGHRRSDYLPPFSGDFPDVAGQGDEVFCYFSTQELDNPALIEALATLGLPLRIVLPDVGLDVRQDLQAGGAIIEPGAISHAQIARRSRVMVHAGQHGSLCLGLGLGLPQIAVPQLLEQLTHAERAAKFGTVQIVRRKEQDAAVFREAIRAAYADVGRRSQAADLARDLRPQLVADLPAILSARVTAAMAG